MKKVTFKWEGEHFSVASCHYRKKKKKSLLFSMGNKAMGSIRLRVLSLELGQ